MDMRQMDNGNRVLSQAVQEALARGTISEQDAQDAARFMLTLIAAFETVMGMASATSGKVH